MQSAAPSRCHWAVVVGSSRQSLAPDHHRDDSLAFRKRGKTQTSEWLICVLPEVHPKPNALGGSSRFRNQMRSSPAQEFLKGH